VGAPALSATPGLVASSTARDPSEVTYVSVLLRSADGAPLGTLWLFDLVPRPLEASVLTNLYALRPSIERALWSRLTAAPYQP